MSGSGDRTAGIGKRAIVDTSGTCCPSDVPVFSVRAMYHPIVFRVPLVGLVLVTASGLLSTQAVQGQSADDRVVAIASWVAVDAPTGYETRGAPALASALGDWTADRWGNVASTFGSGEPHHVIACALDRPTLVVSQITDDGYLRVHRTGRASRHPLWDQQFTAQQVRVLTAAGPVIGVVAQANGHFSPQHRLETAVLTADDLWVDVGASSHAEVEALGITLLDPLARHLPPWPIANAVAGPDAGRRVGCAAIATLSAAVRRSPPAGRVTFVLGAQEGHGWVGLSSLIARAGAVHRVTVIAPAEGPRVDEPRTAAMMSSLAAPWFSDVLEASGVTSVHWLAPAAQQTGSHMEIVTEAEAAWLLEAAAREIRLSQAPDTWIAAPAPAPLRTPAAARAYDGLATELTELAERPAVSGHEWSVRRAVLEALPAWARDRAVVDDIGNVTVSAGPESGDATVFSAHMDEVGYLVDVIADDGTVTLASQGGVTPPAWEGQTALLHFDPQGAPSMATGTGADTDARWKAQSLTATAPPPLRGVFRIRAEATTRRPEVLQAWFGLDGAALEARGVRAGMQVTSHKSGLRMGVTRYTARSLDDRAGTTAMLRAMQAVDPTTLSSRVIFAFSVHEEGGLNGAAAMARRFGRETHRVYSIDTFVSSDTPLESPHFAHAPLGRGPVLRAIETTSASTEAERTRVQDIVRRAGLPLQIGLTQGGTDGTAFTYWGAPNQGLSWPGRYSHSPAEVLDLRDLDALGKVIAAIATAP
jgi:putative aminopeptidase